MTSEKAVGIVALAGLVGALLLMARLIQKGRKMVALLAQRHPDTYEALGRPRPGYFHSPRRSSFSRFIASREYMDLADAELCAQFDAYRKDEAKLLISLLGTLAIVAGLVFWVRSRA